MELLVVRKRIVGRSRCFVRRVRICIKFERGESLIPNIGECVEHRPKVEVALAGYAMIVFAAYSAGNVFEMNARDVACTFADGFCWVLAIDGRVADIQIDTERITSDVLNERKHLISALHEEFWFVLDANPDSALLGVIENRVERVVEVLVGTLGWITGQWPAGSETDRGGVHGISEVDCALRVLDAPLPCVVGGGDDTRVEKR